MKYVRKIKSDHQKLLNMKLKSRCTPFFIEIKVDEIEATVFKRDKAEINDMIFNLLDVANDLALYTDKSLAEYVREFGL